MLRNFIACAGVIVMGVIVFASAGAANREAADDAVWAAICPVVYAVDESAAERGFHYIFYGNAFFINDEGYLLTAAHVLTDFQSGGQPQILLRFAEAPPKLVKVEVVATDIQHDVAILRAVPNPFKGRYQVAFLRLSTGGLGKGATILAAALRPGHMRDPHTFDAPQEDRALGDVVQFTEIALNKGEPKAELFLFNHEVIRGQSGAPILSRGTGEVVGFVEGQWLHGIPLASATSAGDRGTTMGAGVAIRYALPLLAKEHVAWQAGKGAK
jgi:S1-C subfamily serine protease